VGISEIERTILSGDKRDDYCKCWGNVRS